MSAETPFKSRPTIRRAPLRTLALTVTLLATHMVSASSSSDEPQWLEMLSQGGAAYRTDLALVEYQDDEYLSLEKGWLSRLQGDDSDHANELGTDMHYQTDFSDRFLRVRFFYPF